MNQEEFEEIKSRLDTLVSIVNKTDTKLLNKALDKLKASKVDSLEPVPLIETLQNICARISQNPTIITAYYHAKTSHIQDPNMREKVFSELLIKAKDSYSVFKSLETVGRKIWKEHRNDVEVPVILTTACRFKLTTSCRSKLTTLCRLKLTT